MIDGDDEEKDDEAHVVNDGRYSDKDVSEIIDQ